MGTRDGGGRGRGRRLEGRTGAGCIRQLLHGQGPKIRRARRIKLQYASDLRRRKHLRDRMDQSAARAVLYEEFAGLAGTLRSRQEKWTLASRSQAAVGRWMGTGVSVNRVNRLVGI